MSIDLAKTVIDAGQLLFSYHGSVLQFNSESKTLGFTALSSFSASFTAWTDSHGAVDSSGSMMLLQTVQI